MLKKLLILKAIFDFLYICMSWLKEYLLKTKDKTKTIFDNWLYSIINVLHNILVVIIKILNIISFKKFLK